MNSVKKSRNWRKVYNKRRNKKIERNERKRKNKRKIRRLYKQSHQKISCEEAKFLSKIKSFEDAVNIFLPKNLKYILGRLHHYYSPIQWRAIHYREERIILMPEVFSIIDNPKASYEIVYQVIYLFINQKCTSIRFNYNRCKKVDLLTQVFFDAILKDIYDFMDLLAKKKLDKYCTLKNMGAFGYKNIYKIINTVGSPAILINRLSDYSGVKPFRLRYFDAENSSFTDKMSKKEMDTTEVLEYINRCLKTFHRELNPSALQQLGYVIGEILINAEEHSSTKARYMIGYMEEIDVNNNNHNGVFNLVIMNFGKTIYEVFKYPDINTPVNQTCLSQMKELSDRFTNKKWFGIGGISEESLWTLYSLQQGVTRVPERKRGNGTIQFIESFFKLKDKDKVTDDDISRMYLLSGKTVIEFDGKYRLRTEKDSNGLPRGTISFNESGSIFDKPDTNYVRTVDNYFPGTALYVRLLLNDNDFEDGK